MAYIDAPLSEDAPHPERDDVSLLAAIARDRDKDAFCELFERYKVRAYNLACNLAHNRSIAEDGLQEAMLAVWQSSRTFESNEEARGWILGIVANKSLSAVRTSARSHKREQRRREVESYEMSNCAVDNEEVLQALRQHIEKLPAIERQILTLRYTDGLPQEKIGQLLSIPQQTISRRLQEALASLRGSLQNAGLVAILPLVGMQTISEAISSGHSLPPGLSERMLGTISSAGVSLKATQSLSSASAPKAALNSIPMGLFIVATAMLTTVILTQYAWQKPPVANTSSAVLPRKKFERTWNLDSTENLSTLKRTRGSWTFLPKGGVNESGCFESANDVDTEVELDLTGFAKDAPLRISFDWQMMTRSRNYRADARWTSHEPGFAILAMNANYSQQVSAWLNNTVFVTPDFICTYMGPNRVSIRFAKKTPQSPLALELHGGAIRIDNIKISEMDPSELPSIQEYKLAVEKMERPGQNQIAVVPNVAPFQESKQVGVFFFEASK